MSQKIRIGNDIDIRWSLIDGEQQPYILEGKDITIELDVGTKKIRITEFEVTGNTMHFVFYGKDQKYLGNYILKYVENDGEIDMVTFDTKDAFELVQHSWLALDAGEQADRIYLEFVTVTSQVADTPPIRPAEGTNIRFLWAGTQTEYDNLTPSNDTVYLIKEE